MKEKIGQLIISSVICMTICTAKFQETKRRFILGGIFPVHHEGDGTNPCGALRKEIGIQGVMAMLYAIKNIHARAETWNFTLEPYFLDSCSSESHALYESQRFLNIVNSTDPSKRLAVTGIIGGYSSPVSESTASFFRVFKIPQVSYASTSTVFDDLHKYAYFFRVVPSNVHQTQAIIDLAQHLNWTTLSTVASEGDYGENAIQELKNRASFHSICVITSITLSRKPIDEEYTSAVQQLIRNTRAKAVVVFLYEHKLRKLFSTAEKLKVKSGNLLWIGSNTWGSKDHLTYEFESIMEGAITIAPVHSIDPGFDSYFKKRISYFHQEKQADAWFKEFWESQFNCTFNGSKSGKTDCYAFGVDDLSTKYIQSDIVPKVVDAVNVMATALKNMCSNEPDLCRNEGDPTLGEKLKDYIQSVSVESSTGTISFDNKRSVPVNYTIYQFRKSLTPGKNYEYVHLGSWSTQGLNLVDDPYWIREDGTRGQEKSICSPPCEPGHERMISEKLKCCWWCHLCEGKNYLEPTTSRCSPCPRGSTSDSMRTSCIPMETEYFGKDLDSSWTMIPLIFSLVGIICTSVTYAIYLMYHSTPIIMASGRELCHVIFAGVFMTYIFTFPMISRPTPFICGFAQVLPGLALSMCYGAIFTKTNRISRIFNRAQITKRPKYLTPKSQLLICLFLVMLEFILSLIWLLVFPPEVSKTDSITTVVEMCIIGKEYFGLKIVYNGMLVILCTFYAYKTRNIPENFNETKHISFMMYSTCIIWMAFVPTYFSISSEYKVKGLLTCMSVSMSGTVALGFIFFPKVYVVIFQPQKNVRRPSGTSSAGNNTGKVEFIIKGYVANTLCALCQEKILLSGQCTSEEQRTNHS